MGQVFILQSNKSISAPLSSILYFLDILDIAAHNLVFFVRLINISLFKNKFSENSNEVENIVLGGSYSVLTLLERGNKVTHICADPVLEAYTSTFWPNILVRKLNDNSFNYHLKKFGSCIQLGEPIHKLDKYIN